MCCTLTFLLHVYFLFPVNQRIISKPLLFSSKTLFYTDRSHSSYHHNFSWDFFQSSQNHMLNVLISFPICLFKSQFLTLWITANLSFSMLNTSLMPLQTFLHQHLGKVSSLYYFLVLCTHTIVLFPPISCSVTQLLHLYKISTIN